MALISKTASELDLSVTPGTTLTFHVLAADDPRVIENAPDPENLALKDLVFVEIRYLDLEDGVRTGEHTSTELLPFTATKFATITPAAISTTLSSCKKAYDEKKPAKFQP